MCHKNIPSDHTCSNYALLVLPLMVSGDIFPLKIQDKFIGNTKNINKLHYLATRDPNSLSRIFLNFNNNSTFSEYFFVMFTRNEYMHIGIAFRIAHNERRSRKYIDDIIFRVNRNEEHLILQRYKNKGKNFFVLTEAVRIPDIYRN
jgi:hypothetical protein